MKKKVLGITLMLLVIGVASVFAQVCLDKTSVRVRDLGNGSINVHNNMSYEVDIEVIYTIKTGATGNRATASIRVPARGNMPASGKEYKLATSAGLVDYTVWTCN